MWYKPSHRLKLLRKAYRWLYGSHISLKYLCQFPEDGYLKQEVWFNNMHHHLALSLSYHHYKKYVKLVNPLSSVM